MALKDWKKTKEIGTYTRWENGSEALRLDKTIGEYGEKGRWFVLKDIGSPEFFNSKSEALAYAKKYMRTH